MKSALALVVCLLGSVAEAATFSGRVVKIADGDNLNVLDTRKEQHKIRLAGIDALERGQPFGTVSGDHLGKLVFGKQVTVTYDKHDKYGRIT
jgi:endonuclease YncB( thermonuclease family)